MSGDSGVRWATQSCTLSCGVGQMPLSSHPFQVGIRWQERLMKRVCLWLLLPGGTRLTAHPPTCLRLHILLEC